MAQSKTTENHPEIAVYPIDNQGLNGVRFRPAHRRFDVARFVSQTLADNFRIPIPRTLR